MEKKRGFTLIEVLIVIAIIGILGAIALSVFRGIYQIKARMTEITNAMAIVSTSIGGYYNNNYSFPPLLVNAIAIKNTLGVSVPTGRMQGGINGINVDNFGAITVIIDNIASEVNSSTLVLTPNIGADGAIYWSWSGSVSSIYLPKN